MAIQWGAWAGHMRVGIDVWTDGFDTNTPAINVYVAAYVQIDGSWNFADNQHMEIGGGHVVGHWDFFNNMGANQTRHIGTAVLHNQQQNYNGGPTYYFGARLTGHYQGASPFAEVYYSLPHRPANVPTAPGIAARNIGVSTAHISVSPADPRGWAIDFYETQVDNNSDFSSPHFSQRVASADVSGLSGSTTYYARSRAHNGPGYGDWAYTQFTTSATAPAQVSTPSITGVGQTSAEVRWLRPADGGSQIDSYEVQYATNSSFTSGVRTEGSSDLYEKLVDLKPGQQYWVRVRARNGVGAGAYSSSGTFTTLAGTPVITSPNQGASVTDSVPSVTVVAEGIDGSKVFEAQWSQSSTFASGVKSATYGNLTQAASYVLRIPTEYLRTGAWYARVRVRNTQTGFITPWSTVRSYNLAHSPSAQVQSPTAGATAGYSSQVPFSWKFLDPAPGDAQTAYRLMIENNATGDVVFDSGKTALATAGGNTIASVNVPIPANLKNVSMRWRVMVWDKGDSPSLWSGYSIFRLADLPVVTIVAPAPGAVLDNGAPTFTWSSVIPSGGNQARAVVTVYTGSTNEVVWETTVTGVGNTVTPSVVILRNATAYYFRVAVTDTDGLTGDTQATFTTSYEAPDSVAYNIAADDPDELGYVLIDWSDANPDDLFQAWKVYRKTFSTDWELLTEITAQDIRSYRDFMLVAGESYTYSVTQMATRSGSVLESPVGYRRDNESHESLENRYAAVDLTYYWIIDPDNPHLSIKLNGVISDPSTLEFESATYNIIGRGRHRDYGDELGYTGSLSVQVRVPERPSRVRLAVEAMRRAQETYWLRTPFGRLFPIAIGDIGWDPVAGVGTSEMGDMTIPYEEVH